jgi:acyl dehydratase
MASHEPTKPVSTRRGWYFEEFEVGMVFESGPIEITREMISSFAELTGDNNRLHVDPEFMRESEFGDVIAHGLLLESLAIGRVADLGIFQGTTLALLSANCQFKHAATPGDQLRIELEISDKRPSSKPGRGVLFRDMRILNQHGHLLVQSELVSLMRTSPPAGQDER